MARGPRGATAVTGDVAVGSDTSLPLPSTAIIDTERPDEAAARVVGEGALVPHGLAGVGGALTLAPKGVGAGAEYLNTRRQWRGLAYDNEEATAAAAASRGGGGGAPPPPPSTVIGEGAVGVAAGYGHEGAGGR